MIDECIGEAKVLNLDGVAVVTRKGSFMADKNIFLKKGFKCTDTVKPDFELLALKFNINASDPKFKPFSLDKYEKGLTIIRSAQCPYSVKNVDAILETAQKLKIKANLVEIKDHGSAQQTPCAFGTFCIIHDNEVISHHPISNARFENIMAKRGIKL